MERARRVVRWCVPARPPRHPVHRFGIKHSCQPGVCFRRFAFPKPSLTRQGRPRLPQAVLLPATEDPHDLPHAADGGSKAPTRCLSALQRTQLFSCLVCTPAEIKTGAESHAPERSLFHVQQNLFYFTCKKYSYADSYPDLYGVYA